MTSAWTLPSGWSWVALKRLAAVPLTNGLGEATDVGRPEWPRYVRTTDIADAWHLRDDVRASLPPEVAAKARLRQGDLVLCSAGSLDVFHLFTSAEPACFAGYLTRFRANPTKADARYLTYCAASAPFRWQVSAGAVHSTIDNYSASKYANTYLAVPAVTSIQFLIADFLDRESTRISALADHLESLARLAHQHTDSRRREVFRGDIVSAALDAGQWPAGWPRLAHFVDRWYAGGTPTSDNPDYWTDEPGAPIWVAIGDMSGQRMITRGSRKLTPQGITAARLRPAPKGTLLLAMYASVGEIGELDHRAYFNQALIGMYIGDALLREFVYEWLVLMRPFLSWFTKSNTQANLTAGLVRRLPIPAAGLLDLGRRLDEIRTVVKAEDNLTAAVNTMGDRLRDYRDALITEAVTGKLDVTKLSDQQLGESAQAAMEGERPEVLSA